MYLMCSLVVVIARKHKIQMVHKHFQVIYQASSMFSRIILFSNPGADNNLG